MKVGLCVYTLLLFSVIFYQIDIKTVFGYGMSLRFMGVVQYWFMYNTYFIDFISNHVSFKLVLNVLKQ